MQTPAERYLIKKNTDILLKLKNKTAPRIINLGAAKSIVIETAMAAAKVKFICDRTDVNDCRVKNPLVGQCFSAYMESMPNIKPGKYPLAFANYVLEHVSEPNLAAREINRILKPNGYFVTTISNPTAPEFRLSKHTPLWFHQTIKGEGQGKEAYETHYNYKNIQELADIFNNANLKLQEAKYFCFTYGYLYRFPIINILSKVYDWIINLVNIKTLQGQVCLVFQKNVDTAKKSNGIK